MMRSLPRLLLATTLAALVLWGALALQRVDTSWWPAAGPDRLIKSMDADPALAPGDAANARTMLRDRPIDGRAYRVLAQAAGTQGDVSRRDALHAIAARRAPRDRPTRAASIDRAFASGEPDVAFEQLDALLRTAPQLRDPLLRALLPLLHDPRVRTALVERLASDPPWRSALPPILLDEGSPPGSALSLLAQLGQRSPRTAKETEAYVTLLQRAGRDAEARREWLHAVSPRADAAHALLFDGGFEQPDVAGAFGWHIGQPPGVTVENAREDVAEGRHALSFDFADRAINGFALDQSITLAPGRYRLQVAYDNDTDSTRPFVWKIMCKRGRPTLLRLELEAGRTLGWRHGGADFQVPSGCAAQTLALRHDGRSIAERQFKGRLRLDGMQILHR